MRTMGAPSTALLRTFLKPSTLSQCTNQLRQASNYMPRSKYAKTTRLDKLHRTQRSALRQEKLLATQRADTISVTLPSNPSSSSQQTYSFTIARTPSSQLPIYEHAKNGGNKHVTVIRKLQGDLDSLAGELRAVLKMSEYAVDQKGNKKANVAVNRLTNQVVVRGWRGREVKAWMEAVGF